jgi:hypothetical protein
MGILGPASERPGVARGPSSSTSGNASFGSLFRFVAFASPSRERSLEPEPFKQLQKKYCVLMEIPFQPTAFPQNLHIAPSCGTGLSDRFP